MGRHRNCSSEDDNSRRFRWLYPTASAQIGSDGRVSAPSAGSVDVSANSPVALIDHARAERPGLDQLQLDVRRNRREERRAAADDDRMAEYAQLIDQAELDRRPGEAGAGD